MQQQGWISQVLCYGKWLPGARDGGRGDWLWRKRHRRIFAGDGGDDDDLHLDSGGGYPMTIYLFVKNHGSVYFKRLSISQ